MHIRQFFCVALTKKRVAVDPVSSQPQPPPPSAAISALPSSTIVTHTWPPAVHPFAPPLHPAAHFSITTRHVIALGESNCGKVRAHILHLSCPHLPAASRCCRANSCASCAAQPSSGSAPPHSALTRRCLVCILCMHVLGRCREMHITAMMAHFATN
jgi:hypothetical protein